MITAHRSNSKRLASYENLEEHKGMGCKEQKGNGNKLRKVRQIIQTRALCARLKLSHLVTFRLKRREK